MANEESSAEFTPVATVLHPTSPVQWTPEDAANFIGSAIREAQIPTLEAMRRRGVSKWFYGATCLFFIALLAAGGWYIFYLTTQLATAQAEIGRGLNRDVDAAFRAGAEKVGVAAAVLAQTTESNREIADATRWREQLTTARQELEARAAVLAQLKEKVATLEAQLQAAQRQTAATPPVTNETIEKLRTEQERAQAEAVKAKAATALRDRIIAQQKEEIAVLRQQLATAQTVE
ncbi:hypothetical protein FACS1894139_03760 [Planctomycetales bacterium]|nr:hypothetical protein FACS1894107_16390 [Planctomycetales bacterium]GHS97683.1 hypothetical protein FACS1894108_04470 [Planctomycetales bacterium]GHT03452.1 hypothetical protein FACS1894139_03760 [Planctomycetales bacterium]